jgi:hypothetical protein
MKVGAGAWTAAICGVVVVLVTACSPPVVGPPGPAPGPPPVPAPRLDRFYAQQLSWGPCAPFADTPEDRIGYADERFACARISAEYMS